jgi:glutamyl-tRNA synthetase
MEDIRREALRWALANALEHKGKANVKSVLRKLLAELPGQKPKVGELTALVEGVVSEVNALSLEEQRFQLRKVGAPKKPEPERREGLPELPGADRVSMIVTRFAPNPNGPLHLGNARAAILSHEYARMYRGKFILRFEDTNPENVLLEMYELIKRDLRWLGMSWDEEYEQSKRLRIYYTYAEQLLGDGKAYICTCKIERFRALRDRGEPCPCRGLPSGEHLARWGRMLGGDIEPGEAVVRIKTDLGHPNPALRDWPAMRVVKRPHPRVGGKYSVWPLYNFSVSIDDHEMGITHILRGKEHEVNEQRQRTLYLHLGWEYPVAVQYGRLKIPGAALSKTQTVRAIKSGKLTGYDDVSLATLAALRRRGFTPEAIKRAIVEVGLTLVDSSLSWETLCAYNRRVVDAVANRYFFVPDPVKLVVRGGPDLKEVRIRLHPGRPEAGERISPLSRRDGDLIFHIPACDVEKLREGDLFRLKDLMNVRLERKGEVCEAEFQGLGVIDVPKIQWVSGGALPLEVLVPDGRVMRGLAEPAVASLEPGVVVQFERYGFVRMDAVTPRLVAVFAHR